MSNQNQNQPRPAGHVAACLSSGKGSEQVLKKADELRQKNNSRFTALYVEPPYDHSLPKEEVLALKENMRLARDLGAKVEILDGWDAAELIAGYCASSDVSDLVIGHSNRGDAFFFEGKSLAQKLTGRLDNVNIHIVSDSLDPQKSKRKLQPYRIGKTFWMDCLKTAVIFLCATLTCAILDSLGIDPAVLAPVYILGVLITGVSTESWLWPVVGAILSILLFNFFFAYPRFSFAYYYKDYTVIFAATFITALLCGVVTSRTNKMLQDVDQADEVPRSLCQRISTVFHKDVVFIPWDAGLGGTPEVYFTHPNPSQPFEYAKSEQQAVRTCALKGILTGIGTKDNYGSSFLYIPLRTQERTYGVIGIRMDRDLMDSPESLVIRSMITAGAMRMEILIKEKEVQEIRMKNQEELQRSNMLKAISHDLRTPLTSIMGNVANLHAAGVDQVMPEQGPVIQSIYDSSQVLKTMVENLLCAARMENGTMPLKETPEDLGDVITSAMDFLGSQAKTHPVSVDVGDDILIASMDSSLITQVINNIVINAFTHTPDGTPVRIEARKDNENNMAMVSIIDEGQGIADEIKPRIFDLFYTGNSKILDSASSLGLGLYLCKTIVEAHHGTLTLKDNEPHGCIFTFSIPCMDY